MIDWPTLQKRMARDQVARRGIADPRIVDAIERVPRHEFVPPEYLDLACDDGPLPIGFGQTISQPYVVAYMVDALGLTPHTRVLEIGTGSGYQTAILSRLAERVYTIEIVPELAVRAARTLHRLGVSNVVAIAADGRHGWPRAAPFQAIVVSAAADGVPAALVEQMQFGARLVAPIGSSRDQTIVRLTRSADGLRRESLIDVRFVPLTREDR